MIFFILNNGTISQPPIPPPVTFAVDTNNISDDGTYLDGAYTIVGGVEKNSAPYFNDGLIVGNISEATELTISAKLTNNSQYSPGGHVLKVYKGSSAQDLNPVLASTISSFTVNGERIEFEYTVSIFDIGKFLRFVLTPKLTAGDQQTGVDYLTDYTVQVTAQPSPLDVFDRIWTYGEIIDSDWNSNSAAKSGKYVGSAAPGQQNGAAPTLSGSSPNKYLAFNGTSHRIQQAVGSPAMVAGFEIWILMNLRSTSGTKTIWAGSSSIDVRVVSGQLQMRQNGTGQNVGAATTGKKLYRFGFNGSSSFVQINAGTKVVVAASPGTSLPGNNILSTFGSNFALTGSYSDIDLYGWGIRSTAMSDSQAEAVFSHLGYPAP